MKRLLNWKFFLLLIVVIATLLRFYQLGTNSPSLTWDEAAWGYNAYSLGIDGKDEFGRLLPINYLESFGDFKPPMYAYLDILPVKLLGLNEFSTRFPSALFGVLTVFLTFFLVSRIFPNSKNKTKLALFSAFFLAISPWHVMLSRAAFEANVATFFLCLGVWGFLAGVQNKRWFLLISAISFALSMYTFNTSRVVAPLLVIILIIVFRKQLIKNKFVSVSAAILGLFIFIPLIGFLITPQAGLRFKEVNIFTDVSVVKTANQEIANDGNNVLSKVLHNRRVLFGLEYVKHYMDNLNPSFLFIKGDGNPKFSTQNNGQMYVWDIIFFISGILILLKVKQGNWWLVPVWLIVGIIPAATARETPHALRIETTLPMFQIFTAVGFVAFLEWVDKLNFKRYLQKLNIYKIIPITVFILLIINFVFFYHDLVFHYPYEYSGEWQYGYKQSINYVKSVEKNYDYVQVTNALGRPYIYYLFYTNTSPTDFRKSAVINRDAFGFVDVYGFGKYLFPRLYEYNLSKSKRVLYINTPVNLPTNIKILKTFYLLNDYPVLVAYTLD